jgi:hypothetical protein
MFRMLCVDWISTKIWVLIRLLRLSVRFQKTFKTKIFFACDWNENEIPSTFGIADSRTDMKKITEEEKNDVVRNYMNISQL